MDNQLTNEKELEDLAKKMRYSALEMSFNSGQATHLGGGLSIIDIMAVLYGKILSPKINKKIDHKNRFILSKGHGVLGLLSALHCVGILSKEEIMTFQTNGSKYIAHPIMNEKAQIESSNGSLGQGLSMGIGIALSYVKKNKNGNIYVLVGDGECYEGSIWEAAISAVDLNLDNITVIVDCNGFQNDGPVGKAMKYESIFNKWSGFGWECIKCDGHNIQEIIKCFSNKKKGVPKVVLAKTIKGKGIKFMENNNDWHHNRLSQKLFEEAIKDLGF